jgi:hypothetical protein
LDRLEPRESLLLAGKCIRETKGCGDHSRNVVLAFAWVGVNDLEFLSESLNNLVDRKGLAVLGGGTA